MHLIHLGLIKYFVDCWLGNVSHFKKVLIDAPTKAMLNSTLVLLQIPAEFTRTVRSLEEIARWKAEEFHDFAIYFFVLMDEFLPSEYFLHFRLFVEAFRILSRPSITAQKFDRATKLMNAFQSQLHNLYGDRIYTIKIHKVVFHLFEYVRLYGPLNQFSATMYEAINGKLIRKYFGKYKIISQLMFKFNMPSVIQTLIEILDVEDDDKMKEMLG